MLDGARVEHEARGVGRVEPLRHGVDLQLHDVREHGLAERVEDDDLVEAVEELGPEFRAHRVEHLALDLRELRGAAGVVAVGRVRRREVRDALEDELRADVRPVCKSNLQPDFNVRVFECFDTSTSAVLRELAESNRFVQKSAESTSI